MAGLLGLGVWSVSCQADVFNMPHFVESGQFALGLEPILTLTNGAGVGVKARYTQGINDLMNGTFLLGTGSGPRRFRVGGNLTFDFFPDVEGQPGIGLGVQSIYYRLPNAGQLELQGVPYIHKSFALDSGNQVEPYFAFPFGFGFSEGNYKVVTNVTVGALFKRSEHISYDFELGVNVNNSDSYFAGGIIYYH